MSVASHEKTPELSTANKGEGSNEALSVPAVAETKSISFFQLFRYARQVHKEFEILLPTTIDTRQNLRFF